MSIFIFILVTTAFVFLPFFANPDLLLNRNNDLTEFFWPLFYYSKESILKFHQIPLWNNMFFAGTPLSADPQNPIYYLPNIIFLFFSIDKAILISLMLHTLFGITGAYLASRQIFKFSKTVSIIISILFTFSPKLFSLFAAGHWGLIISYFWIPYFFFFAYRMAKDPNRKWASLFAISFSAIFFNHLITSLIILAGSFLFFLIVKAKEIKLVLFSFILSFGLVSISLIPQLEWLPQTTRNFLLLSPETFPIWNGKREFLQVLLLPLLKGSRWIVNLDPEKLITLGTVVLVTSISGFIKLPKKIKVYAVLFFAIITLLTLNNVSPIYKFLIRIDWYSLIRVPVKFWILAQLAILALFGFSLEILSKRFPKLILILGVIAICESLIIGYSFLTKPVPANKDIPPIEFYNYFQKDSSNFRIFCLTRCIPQKQAAIRNLQLVEGYGTLQQQNYFSQMKKITGSYWPDKYSLSIPPFEVYLYQKLKPNLELLSRFNTKYIVSEYPISDNNLNLKLKSQGYYLYINNLWKDFKFTYFSPNRVRIEVSENERAVFTPIVFNSGWKAYENGNQQTRIISSEDSLAKVELSTNAKFVDLVYSPSSFYIGLITFIISLISILENIFSSPKALRYRS